MPGTGVRTVVTMLTLMLPAHSTTLVTQVWSL